MQIQPRRDKFAVASLVNSSKFGRETQGVLMRATITVAVLCLLAPLPGLSQTASHVVISEVYGGGGNTGSTWKNDFVELYNPTNDPVVMTNWSLQYQSASGIGGFTNKAIFSGTIMPRGFFLVQLSQGAGGTTTLPIPDAFPSNALMLSSSAGKVALVRDTLSVTNANDPNVVDFIGYGGANKFEGSGPAPTLSNTTSAERKASGSSTASSLAQGGSEQNAGNGWDSDNNASDFVVQTAISPQNSASPKEPAGSILAGIGSAVMSPSVIKADTGIALSFIIRGTTQGT
ncbi:MAG: lamin tail domain-containing protein, partial [Ignavibacteria bacterium]|nr:lamin tail domain-containing protein [Ignavibacteria bacterium]